MTIGAFTMADIINAQKVLENPPKDMVNSPEHYRVGGIEAIQYIEAKLSPEEYQGYLRGNALKYLSRMGYKDDVAEQARKAEWYCRRLAEFVEKRRGSA